MIAITGASGYLGSHITRRLVESGFSVRAIVRNKHGAMNEKRLEGLNIEWVEADVTIPEQMDRALAGAEAVIHTVAIAIEKGLGTYETVNFQGTKNVVDAASKSGARRFIYISQLGADANLPYRFLASKGKGKNYVISSGLEWTIFEPAVIWGPEDEFANSFARLIPLTPIIFPIVGDEKSLFQPVWVEDVVFCVQKSLEDRSTIEGIFELGGPEILPLEEIERRTLWALNRRRILIHFPMTILRIFVRIIERISPNPPVTSNLLELLAVSNVTTQNSLGKFVQDPQKFTVENITPYMQQFRVSDTLKKFFGR